MKKKLLAVLLAASATVVGAFGLSACSGGANNQSQNKWGTEYSFASAYAQAQELGYAGTLDEFIAMISGSDGKNGVTPHIGANGNWFIGETDMGVKASGTDGSDGKNGVTPHIGVNGNWFIGETDTGVKASGTDGSDGLGIKELTVNSDNEIVVTWTNGKTTNLGKVPPCKHRFGEWETAIEYSCDSIGIKYRVCKDCEYKDYEFKAAGHNWNDNVCTICGYDAGGSKGLNWQFNDDNTYTLKSWYDSETGIEFTGNELEVPATYNGLPVKSVGAGAFLNNRNLTRVVIRKGVKVIEDEAFYNCRLLSSVDIPEGLIEIGEGVFRSCILSGITIPESVISIGENALRDCEQLTQIHIPDAVEFIGEGAFSSNAKLTSITVGKNNANYYVDGYRLIERNTKTLHSVFDYINMPADIIPADGSVIAIGGGAFRQCAFTDIIIPDGIISIGEYSFSGCNKLTNVIIPESVKSIGFGAFNGCSTLISANIPDGVTSVGEAVFSQCVKLENIDIGVNNANYYMSGKCLIEKQTKTLIAVCDIANIQPDLIPADGSVVAIGSDTFNSVGRNTPEILEKIIIPDCITSIGDRAFYACQNLSSIKLSKNLKSIGHDAFYNCLSLTSVDIPDSVESIGFNVFYNCRNITEFTVGSGVADIGAYAFRNCNMLENIIYKGTMAQWKSVKKDIGWNEIANAFVVTCTDGKLDKNGNEITE